MKKVLLLLAFLPILLACSSDDDKFIPTGTYSTRITNYFGDEVLTYNIRFMSGGQYEFTYRIDDFVSGVDMVVSTYTLDYPKICFKDFDEGEDVVGEFIDERTLRVSSHEYIKK